MEAMVTIILNILVKMRSDKHSAFLCFPKELQDFGDEMWDNKKRIWRSRKVWPSELPKADILLPFGPMIQIRKGNLADVQDSDAQIWSSFHLVWSLLFELSLVLTAHSFEDPRRTVPAKLWLGLADDCDNFIAVVDEVIEAFKSQIPSFTHLLKILCNNCLE